MGNMNFLPNVKDYSRFARKYIEANKINNEYFVTTRFNVISHRVRTCVSGTAKDTATFVSAKHSTADKTLLCVDHNTHPTPEQRYKTTPTKSRLLVVIRPRTDSKYQLIRRWRLSRSYDLSPYEQYFLVPSSRSLPLHTFPANVPSELFPSSLM